MMYYNNVDKNNRKCFDNNDYGNMVSILKMLIIKLIITH